MASAQNMDDTAARRSEKPRGRNVSNIIREFGQVDRPFMIIVILLVSVGSILVFSASYANAESRFGDSYYFVKSQIKYILVGLPAMVITARFADTRLLKRYAWAIFGLALVLCYAIRLVPGIGIESHGAYRWINLYFFQFQPSELLKLSIILVCARYISDNQGRMRTMKYGFLPFAVIAIPVVGAMLLQKHLSGTIICCLILFFMMYVGGTHPTLLTSLCAVGALGAGILFTVFEHAQQRLMIWRDPFSFMSAASGGKGWQPAQSLYAISSGGFWGLGLGNSNQKHSFLPEPQNDYIFAIGCEELGFLGASLIIVLYMLFAWRGFVIARNSKDRFGSLIVLGLVFKTMAHVILNIAVVTNTIPSTGITLPFMSYGGSSLVMQLVEMGIILSVSRYSYSSREA